MPEHLHITTSRTAKLSLLGNPGNDIREIWFVLHGYGQLADYFIRYFEPLVIPGALVVAPEALSRFYTDGMAGRVGASWMTKEDRESEMLDYIHYLDLAYDAVSAKVGPDFTFNLLGFSQGAATACRWLTGGTPKPVHNLVCWSGFFPPDMQWTASGINQDTSVHVVSGSRDPLITPEAVAAQQQLISRLELQPRIWEFDGGHTIHQATLIRLAELIRNCQTEGF